MRVLLLICLLFSTVVYGQDDSGSSIVRSVSTDSNVEVVFHDNHKKFATVKTYNKADVLETEENYSDYGFREKQGFTKCYYPSGQLYWICDYKKNILNGEFRVYYESGTLKRKEFYKRGVRKSEQCFDENENEIPFTPFFQSASFVGGEYELQAYLRKYIKSVKVGSISEYVSINLSIKSDSTAELRYMSPNLLVSNQLVSEMVSKMPKWSPTTYDGLALTSAFALNLVFSHGQVYLSNLIPNTSKNARSGIHNIVIPVTPPPFPERKTIKKA